MNKNESSIIRLSIAMSMGLVLGFFALLIISFTTYTTYQNKIMEVNEQEKQIKHDLILTVKNTCSPVYPVVHAAIYRDRIIVECRLK